MEINELLKMVDSERIYRTLLDIEGEKHPVLSPEALEQCGAYIKREMELIGLNVREHCFRIGNSERVFKNIEGSIGPVETEKAAVLTAHYDTVEGSPGANDDGSGIAAMLEIARVISAMDNPPPVYFVAVTLEENNNPEIWEPERVSAIAHGILDKKGQYMNWRCAVASKSVWDRASQEYFKGMSYEEGIYAALESGDFSVPEQVERHYRAIAPLYRDIRVENAMGVMNRIGSHYWLKDAIAEGKGIAFNITLDEIGTYKKGVGTQKELAGVNLFSMFTDHHRTDADRKVADFLLVASEVNSEKVGRAFSSNCRLEDVDLPFGWIHLPLDFHGVRELNPMALNSDHANFWKAGIPSIFIFDSSLARDTYVHSGADTIDKLDFDRIRQISQAVVATLNDRTLY